MVSRYLKHSLLGFILLLTEDPSSPDKESLVRSLVGVSAARLVFRVEKAVLTPNP